jgi:alkane 1-monooxygenase
MRALKYLLAYSLPLTVAVSFSFNGWFTFLPLIYAFGFIPGIDFLLKADGSNLESWEQEVRREDRLYDGLLYFLVPLQYVFLFWYLSIISETALGVEFWGRSSAMGLLCGVIGINVGHELGHRSNKIEQRLAKLLLFSSLYGHFFVEHNYGHHKNVATLKDPATARKNEMLYSFLLRSIFLSYWDAWKIQANFIKSFIRQAEKTNPGMPAFAYMFKIHFINWRNEMLNIHLLQASLLALVYFTFGWFGVQSFLLAAAFGIVLLETVNYIEHYGLIRAKISPLRYESANPAHSWNSNHLMGRLVLFELSRHSDHHAHPHKKYQLLEHYDESPQLPTGYPGMMLLASVPPLWFAVMNKKLPNS